MNRAALMVQGTGSDVGKSAVVAGLSRLLRRRGVAVAPFKPQNMSNNAAACPVGGEIGRAQALQARAAGLPAEVDMNPVLLKPQTDRVSQLVVQGRAVSTVDAARYMAERGSLLAPIMASFERLAERFDLILVEGAGSPAETNLRAGDVANMGFARRAGVPLLSRIANFDDFDPLRMEPAVEFSFIPPGSPLPRDADVVVLPGTKSTIGDLAFLRAQGWHHDLIAHVRSGGRVLGLCGGYQMLGRVIRDPAGADGAPGEAAGLGLLDVETVMTGDKAVRPVTGTCARSGIPVRGFEIHLGVTAGPDTARPMVHLEHGSDGAASADGRVAGCYVHGLFGDDRFRAQWLDGIRSGTSAATAYESAVEDALDELADCLDKALDVAAIVADAGLRERL